MAMNNFTVAFNNFKNGLTVYLAAVADKFGAVRDRLNAHTDATGNVHGLEPADIGLGNVPDWLPATTKEAQEALSNASFVTPRRVDDYAEENVFKVIGNAFGAASDKL